MSAVPDGTQRHVAHYTGLWPVMWHQTGLDLRAGVCCGRRVRLKRNYKFQMYSDPVKGAAAAQQSKADDDQKLALPGKGCAAAPGPSSSRLPLLPQLTIHPWHVCMH